MAQRVSGLLAGLLLLLAVGAQAADEIPAGTYKVTLLRAGQQSTFWLIKLEEKDGKRTGEVVATRERIPAAKVADVSVKDGELRVTLLVQGDRITFEGKLPPDGKKVLGSLSLDDLYTAHLELTSLKSLDAYEVARETIAQQNVSPAELFDAAHVLLRQASAKKAKPDEVRSWASKVLKASDAYGHRWHLAEAIRVAEALAPQEEYAAEAVQYARQAERLLAPTDKPIMQRRILTALASALKKSGKEDEVKEVEAKLEKIPLVPITKFAGRKGKADQVVAVEMFTGAECPPCVAADLGFDALAKTYTGKEVVLLQYHLHIPGPDPLTNSDAEDRQRYYDIDSTPTIFLNGKAGPEGGGGRDAAGEKYETYIEAINPLLEKEAKAEVKLTAVQKGNKIDITGTVTVPEVSDKLRLRFVLTEEEIKYTGGNKLETHHHVVRDLPGGAKGFALKEKSSKHTATVDLEELQKKLEAYLKEQKLTAKKAPLELKKLHVVALVQNDGTKEIVQAAQVEVKGAE